MNASRLIYLCSDPGIPPDGTKGASVHFREMARALGRAGAGLSVFMARAGSAAAFTPHPLEVVAPRRAPGVAGELHQLAGAAAMLEALEYAGPHEGVYERMSLFGAAGLAYARAHGVPLVLEVNSPLWIEAARFRDLGLRHTARAIACDLLAAADRVLTVSEPLARTVIAAGADPERVEVLGNGVRADLFANATPVVRPEPLRDKPTLVFVGSLKPWHGVEFLLRAFARGRRDRDLGLWVIGSGPLEREVQAAARRLPDSIVHQGAVPHEDVPGILMAADAVVAPYPADAPDWFCPLKVVEALAAGRPLIASRTPCVLGTVASADHPGLFEAEDEQAFAQAVARVLDDPASAVEPRRLEERSWETKARRILRHFAVDFCVEGTDG